MSHALASFTIFTIFQQFQLRLHIALIFPSWFAAALVITRTVSFIDAYCYERSFNISGSMALSVFIWVRILSYRCSRKARQTYIHITKHRFLHLWNKIQYKAISNMKKSGMASSILYKQMNMKIISNKYSLIMDQFYFIILYINYDPTHH